MNASSEKINRVSIIGNGAMATVLALLLDSQGAQVTLWGPFPDHVDALIQTRENKRYLAGHSLPERIHITSDDAQATQNHDLFVNAIPTQYIRRVWEQLAPHITQPTPIVSVAKGVENETLLRPMQIISQVLIDAKAPEAEHLASRLVCLSGPTIASELAKCLPATVVAASENQVLAQTIQKLFTTHWFRVYTHDDPLGVELAGATKNVIALAAGILDGLQAGNNAKSALLSRGLAEITRLGMAMGAKPETFFGVAGVGDLATTCFSPEGRNRTCGEMLGRGQSLEAVLESIPGIVEGVPTTQSVILLAKQHNVEMPITQAISRILFEGLDPLEAISQLMSRELKPERIG